MNLTQDNMTFSVPLTRLAHRYAQEFSNQKISHLKFQEIYLNHLAIYAVDYYLRCLDIETNLRDQASAILKMLSEQSYLKIKGKGKIECRPVLPNERFCYVPVESWSDRMGYIAVRFNSELTEATLLGFLATVSIEQVTLEQFQPLEDVLDCLNSHESKVTLSQWFKEAFTAGWQNLDELLKEAESRFANPSDHFAYQFRNQKISEHQQSIKGAKVLTFKTSDAQEKSEIAKLQKAQRRDMSINLKSQSVILVVAIAPENDEQMSIQIRLYPALEEKYLPANIHLELLSDQGKIVRIITSHQYDNWIQLPMIKCLLNEKFIVRVSLDNVSISETFTS